MEVLQFASVSASNSRCAMARCRRRSAARTSTTGFAAISRAGALNGRKVELAYDPLDLGEAVVYCESRLVGLADCVQLRRMGQDEFVEDEPIRRAARREVKKSIAAVHRDTCYPLRNAWRGAGSGPDRRESDRIEAPAAPPAGDLRGSRDGARRS